MGHAQARHVRPVRGSASLARMSPVPGSAPPAGRDTGLARHPGQDTARDWHTHECGAWRHAGQDAAHGRG
jgi:hypothetical protein